MADLADHRDTCEDGAALASLLDPVALEARLADARARRAIALAAKAEPPPSPAGAWPRRSVARGGLFLGGLAIAAAAALLAPGLRPDAAPEVVLAAAILTPPDPVPSPPAAGVTNAAPTPATPRLAALVLSPMALPPARPEHLVARRTAEPARTRAASAPVSGSAPVLARAAVSAVVSMIRRSPQGRTHSPPAVVRKATRQADAFVEALGQAGRAALTGSGDGVAGVVRRATEIADAAPPGQARASGSKHRSRTADRNRSKGRSGGKSRKR
jgi:hypothetical protein